MYYYILEDKLLFSTDFYSDLEEVAESKVLNSKDGILYFLRKSDPEKSRRSFCISDPSLLFINKEGLGLLQKDENIAHKNDLPGFIEDLTRCGRVMSVNTSYPNWKDAVLNNLPSSFRVNISGLGDVGGILASGLRLLGGDAISKIGLYDIDQNKLFRWKYEISQILSPSSNSYPDVDIIFKEDIFNCDMFVFCVSVGVPPVGGEKTDVRLVQFEGNSKIISKYAKMARERGFKGIFAVVSDPVDLLCKSAFISSNTNELGQLDFKGLAPEQIRGYGLGVMNARAAFYSSQNIHTQEYQAEGRVFGPHGDGLIVANSINNYDNKLSIQLTDMVVNANMDVRKTGYKPYIAPALSSGSLALLSTIKGDWHYSSTFIGGVYMGSRNRLTLAGTQLERLDFPPLLLKRLQETYNKLGDML